MNEFNASRLRYFKAVLDTGSIRAAADKLNTSPSVITRQIQILESEADLALFDRHARGLKPTEAALHLLEYWRGCQAQYDLFVERVRAMQQLESGNVRIVSSEGYVDNLMETVINPFSEHYPKIKLTVDVMAAAEIEAELVSGTAHIGLVYNPKAHPELRELKSVRQAVSAMMSETHPLCKKPGALDVRDLQQYPMALMHKRFGLGQLAEILEATEGIALNPVVMTNSLVVLRRFAHSHHAITLVGTHTQGSNPVLKGLTIRPIDSRLCASYRAVILTHARTSLGLAAQHIVENICMNMWPFHGRDPVAGLSDQSLSHK